MVISAERPITEEQATWQAPKQMSEADRWAAVDQLQKMAGDRIISVSKPLVEQAQRVLAPSDAVLNGAEDLHSTSTMSPDHAQVILQAVDLIEEPIRTTVLTSDKGTIYTFVPRTPVGKEANA